MRVLLLTCESPPFAGAGTAAAGEALARRLAGRGLAVDVITGGASREHTTELVWDGEAADEGTLAVHRIRGRRAGMASWLAAALPVARRLARETRYDVVHVYCAVPAGAMLPLLDLRGAPVVVSLRGSDVPGYHSRNGRLRRAHRVLAPFTRWVWRRADRVVVPSDSLGRLARRALPGLRYSVIPEGVDLARFRPPARPRAYRNDRVRCLAVARLVERKGLTDLVYALAGLEPGLVELEIVGSGPEEPALRGLVTELGLEDRVVFAGALGGAMLARRYAAADLFTLVPWEPSCTSAYAEAMAAGLPIVGSEVGVAATVRHGRNGLLVPPHDPAALAAAIEHLAGRPLLRAELGRRNRADAEARLSCDRVTSRYLTIYNGVWRPTRVPSLLAELPSSTW